MLNDEDVHELSGGGVGGWPALAVNQMTIPILIRVSTHTSVRGRITRSAGHEDGHEDSPNRP